MIKVEKYTGEKNYMFPTGTLADRAAVLTENPSALAFAHIVQTDSSGEVLMALQNLSRMRDVYDIDPALGEAEAIAAIEDAVNAPPPEPLPDPSASALENIAAQLEYQNISSLPDEA